MIELLRRTFLGLAIAAATATLGLAQYEFAPPREPVSIPAVQPVTAPHGMVVAQEARAAEIGVDVLRQGGNAVDAAVAVGFTMAVTC
jgi:gamma-glutamyltranspeptidase / glutathione hydrolase